jgi:hypothetical protein
MKIILKAKIRAYFGVERELPQPYRAVLERTKNDDLVIEQQINCDWFCCGRWGLQHIYPGSDRLYLDFGQGWSVTGISEAVKETEQILASETPVS